MGKGLLFALLLLLPVGPAFAEGEGPTWYGSVKNIVMDKCAGCHSAGNIGPFQLTRFEEVYALRHIIADSVRQDRMPPWIAAKGCNEYLDDISLTVDEKKDLLTWLDAGLPKGDEAEYTASPPRDEVVTFNTEIKMHRPYEPRRGLEDDYRCFIMEPGTTEDMYINGFFLDVDRKDMAHHMLAYLVDAEYVEEARTWEEDGPGSGYSCFGLPSRSLNTGFIRIGSWVPGMYPYRMPGDTGYPFKAGSAIIMQMHYNTLTAGPGGDQSTLKLNLVPKIRRPAVDAMFLNPLWAIPGIMRIPAGETHVEHSWESDYSSTMLGIDGALIGMERGQSFEMFGVHLHMHQLGSGGRIELIRANGERECLLDIRNYDFAWQRGFLFRNEVTVYPGDRVRMTCEWDNSPENQPVVDGRRLPVRNVSWGEGTRDEMCLGGLLYTGIKL